MRLTGSIIVLVLLIAGSIAFNDYGLSWDSPQQRLIGEISYNYVVKGDDALHTFYDRDYGVAYELPLAFIEKTLELKDTRTIYLIRNIATHLLFIVATLLFHILVTRLTGSQLFGLAAVIMLVLHPRIYAHSYFNTKDLPLLSGFIITFFILERAFHYKNLKWFIAAGIASGLLVNLRIVGVLVPVTVLALLLIDLILYRKAEDTRTHPKLLLPVYLFATVLVLIGSWPMLWSDPFGNFAKAFENMSRFRWTGKVLYMGELILAKEIPISYAPVWFSITTPILTLLSGLAGIIWLLADIIRKPLFFLREEHGRIWLLGIGCFFGPLVAVIVFNSVLYDGWRQLYFIYPSFLLMAVYAYSNLWNYLKPRFRKTGVILFVLNHLFIAGWMILHHPFQQVYFNELVSSETDYRRKTFDQDYWGTANYHATLAILKHSTSDSVRISFDNDSGNLNLQLLPDSLRRRVISVGSIGEADYFVGTYRYHPEGYSVPENAIIIYDKKIANSSINTAWALNHNE